MAHSSDPVRWVTEWQFIPRHELGLLTIHICKTLLAAGARETTKRLRSEHGILVLWSSCSSTHDQVVQVLELLLVQLERLASIYLVSELLRQLCNDLCKSFSQRLIKLFPVSLSIDLILQILDQLHYLVFKEGKGIFEIRNSSLESIEIFLTDSTATLHWVFTLLERSDSLAIFGEIV